MNDMAANDPLNNIPDNSTRNENADMAANDPMNFPTGLQDDILSSNEIDKLEGGEAIFTTGQLEDDIFDSTDNDKLEGGESEAPDHQGRYREECKEDVDDESGVQIQDDYNPYSNFQDPDSFNVANDPSISGAGRSRWDKDKVEEEKEQDGFDEDDEREDDEVEGNVHLEQKPCVLSFKVENNA